MARLCCAKWAILLLGFCIHPDAISVQFITDSKNFKLVIENKKLPAAIVDATNSLILKSMGLAPSLLLIPAMRLNDFMDTEKATCTFFKLQTSERSKKYLFSYPTDIFLGVRLYQLKSSAPISEAYLDKQGGLKSLSVFFNRKGNNSLLLLMPGKPFGTELDEEISKINPSSVYFLTAEDPYSAYIDIFFRKRSDFIILYPSVLEPYTKQGIELRSYSLPTAKQFISSRIMCNDTPESRAFIANANKTIKQLYQTEEFIQTILTFTPKADHQLVRDILIHEVIPETLK